MSENVWEARAQYDQEHAAHGYERDSLQAGLAIYGSHIESSCKPFRVPVSAWRHIKELLYLVN